MKKSLIITLLPSFLLSSETILSGYIGSESRFYQNPSSTSREANHAGVANLGVDYLGDTVEARFMLETLQDSDENDRSFSRIQEGYLTYNTEDMQFRVGREILFWGAMEVNNPSDVINSKDLSHDLFDKESKLGALLWRASYYLESSQIDLITKWHENRQAIGDTKNPYFGAIVPLFNEKLLFEKEPDKPTIFLKYSGSTESDYPLDYAIAFMSGYDNLRTLQFTPPASLQWKSYQVNKFITFNTWVVDATLLKFEATYADIVNNDFSNLSDYTQTAIGFEHTLEQLFDGNDLGILVEHNQFHQFDNKRSPHFDFFNNDLFVGVRLAFNDEDSSEILGGFTKDLEYNNQNSSFIEIKTKLFNTLTLQTSYRTMLNSDKDPIASQIGDQSEFGLNLTYHFREQL